MTSLISVCLVEYPNKFPYKEQYKTAYPKAAKNSLSSVISLAFCDLSVFDRRSGQVINKIVISTRILTRTNLQPAHGEINW